MKFIKKGGVPLHQEHEYLAIKSLAEENRFKETTAIGSYKKISILDAYVKHILGLINARNIIKPLKLVVNAGNGAAGHVIDKIESVFNKQKVPIRFIKILHEPDGNFPHGIPNPLLPENHPVISEAVMNNQADLGIAWDGDFDRCFLFDEKGQFIEGYYLVGLLAEAFLRKNPREKIIHDSRLTWNTIDVVTKAGGIPIESRTGHAFMKERMRAENALYGGEVSAHHYFREFAYCDSGMIPWLKVVEILSSLNQPLSMLIEERKAAYPCSGELNFKVDDPSGFIAKVKNKLNDSLNGSEIPNIMTLDGISVEFKDWRFNLRPSNTEPLIRLNLETRKDPQSLKSYMSYVQSIIKEVSY
jgi:phosphomannomutase